MTLRVYEHFILNFNPSLLLCIVLSFLKSKKSKSLKKNLNKEIKIFV